MESAVSSRLFETFRRSVHGLSSGSKGAGSQGLDLLRMSNFGACVDYFLTCFLEFAGEVSEL
jgi:hypothetical protein